MRREMIENISDVAAHFREQGYSMYGPQSADDGCNIMGQLEDTDTIGLRKAHRAVRIMAIEGQWEVYQPDRTINVFTSLSEMIIYLENYLVSPYFIKN